MQTVVTLLPVPSFLLLSLAGPPKDAATTAQTTAAAAAKEIAGVVFLGNLSQLDPSHGVFLYLSAK